MSRRLKPLTHLEGAQRDASHPGGSVWLSASAGTGKTHVLTSRVLRLLLRGADPAAILCLTFTKAGAAEMAGRIHERLADWVLLKDGRLGEELAALGAPVTPASRQDARRLFAKVLDATGGGLRIQTIHAFCATLLAAFPAEAGLVPGFRPIEQREEARLARVTLAALLVEAEEGGRLGLLDDVAVLSRRLGEEEAERFLHGCARAPDAMAALGAAQGIEAQLRRALGVPSEDVEAALAEACGDDRFDRATLARVAEANRSWGTKKGVTRAEAIERWLAGVATDRALALDELHLVWATGTGDPRSFGKGQAPPDPAYAEDAMRLHSACGELLALRKKAAFAGVLAAALRAGQAYAARYAAAKRAAGLVDFDDLIRRTMALLATPGIADWVRYKLDQATDHVLVDEGQDTNADQWNIVAKLTEEFFAGEGAKGGRTRTLFTVGDYKQAIFGFQGTDPRAFAHAEAYFAAKAEAAQHPFARLSLERSFRSSPPVLEVVDRLLADVGGDRLGLTSALEPHRSTKAGQAGRVTLLPAYVTGGDEDGDDESWIDDATRGLAGALARQVRAWLDEPLWLPGKGRALRPEDVMILVRKRGELAGLLVARLHEEGVAVAGVDRLRLSAPLAVQDLLAAIRFVLQPADDLNLASLLISPLLGLSQDDLFALAHGRSAGLLTAVSSDAGFAGTAATLNALLDSADFGTPHQFLEAILSGPMDGRRKLLERLGEEARDPIEELVNAALGFEAEDTPSLQLFLDWFERGDVEIKRDPSAPLDAVRVITVHGAKGLQAPLVILADATVDPDRARPRAGAWEHEAAGSVPIFRPRKDELFPPFDLAIAAADAREREEHWRLLYVAMTRAEEHLVVAGALGPSAKGVPPADSWYQAVDRALEGLGAGWIEDARWGRARHHVGGNAAVRQKHSARIAVSPPPEPAWLRVAAPVEARPPRPLAPSSLGRDDVADPPLPPSALAAARRGRLLHALFERLPALPVERRAELGDHWLAQAHGVEDAEARATLVGVACAIIADARFADVFGPGALAEAPIAAVVGGDVIAGTVDRLCISAERVLVVDFKTGRRAPEALGQVPEHHLRQMGAYAAALAVIFPDRPIEAALLYTAAPRLIAIPPDVLAAHKPGFESVEQSLDRGG